MYIETIDKMIMEALKAGDKVKAGTFRMLKSEFLLFKTAKNAKPLDDIAEISVLKVLLPAEITEEQIKEAVKEVANATEPIKKNMGIFMKAVKAKYPTADGKIVSQVVSTFLS